MGELDIEAGSTVIAKCESISQINGSVEASYATRLINCVHWQASHKFQTSSNRLAMLWIV